MPSTPAAYPQVVLRCLASFRVVDSAVSAFQHGFCAWFDSRQLHHRESWSGPKALASFLFRQDPVETVHASPDRPNNAVRLRLGDRRTIRVPAVGQSLRVRFSLVDG
jgi:hypothetical protein